MSLKLPGEGARQRLAFFPKCTGFGLANLPENAASDGTWLGYNLHSAPYMQNPGVPEAVRTAYAGLAPNDRESRLVAFYDNRQLSIWVHAARMRAIADKLVGLNPDRFTESYDWSTRYILDDGLLLSLANFVMLAIEQTGFAGVPRPDAMGDCGMINIPFGNHQDDEFKTRTNLGYVNVWKKFNDSLDPNQWEAIGARKYNDAYGLCTQERYSYNVSYGDAMFIFEVFKMSSVYTGE